MICLCRKPKDPSHFGGPYRTYLDDDVENRLHLWWCPVSLQIRLNAKMRSYGETMKKWPWGNIAGVTAIVIIVCLAIFGIRWAILDNSRQERESAQAIIDAAAHDKRMNDKCSTMCNANRVISCHVNSDPTWTNKKIIAVCLDSNPEIVAKVEVAGWTDK